MTDTAARVVGPILLTNSSVTLYTVPAATTLIIRNIIIANTSAGAVTVRLSIGADAAGTRILPDVSIPANSVFDWSGFLVLATGQTLRGQAGTTNLLAITVSGVLVT
jgi:hypothetical protein